MIQFFRKIRRNLLNGGETTKYLKYAIGEIMLVMIGILLALQVNNWNEKRKQNQKEIVNLLAIKDDLEHDLETEFINGISYGTKQNNTLNILKEFYINKEIVPKDSIHKYLYNNLFEWNFILNTSAFENLKSSGMDIISNDSLRNKISSLYSNDYSEIESRNSIIMQFSMSEFCPPVYDNIMVFDSTLSEVDFDYLKKSKQINNRVVALFSFRDWLQTKIVEVKSKAELLIEDINKELDLLMHNSTLQKE